MIFVERPVTCALICCQVLETLCSARYKCLADILCEYGIKHYYTITLVNKLKMLF